MATKTILINITLILQIEEVVLEAILHKIRDTIKKVPIIIVWKWTVSKAQMRAKNLDRRRKKDAVPG